MSSFGAGRLKLAIMLDVNTSERKGKVLGVDRERVEGDLFADSDVGESFEVVDMVREAGIG